MTDFISCGDCLAMPDMEYKENTPAGGHHPPRVGTVGFDDVATDLIEKGDLLRKGDEKIEVDEAKAAECYLKAAEQGSAVGAHKLAWMFANGKGARVRGLRAVDAVHTRACGVPPPPLLEAPTLTVPAVCARCQESQREARDLLLRDRCRARLAGVAK